MEKVIYYFSGTGNSLRTARTIAKKLGGARLISMRCNPEKVPAADADTIGFVCPVYEWDVPEPVKEFIEKLSINPNAYIFMVSTYVLIHGRCFETVDKLLREKGSALHYGRPLRCVGSQCVSYEPFPSTKIMDPISEKNAKKIAAEIAAKKPRNYPKMSPVTRKLFHRMMMPFLEIQQEYDKGFYASDKCVGCEVCRKVCPCSNITFDSHRPQWNHKCVGCNACVVYCPTKAIQFKTPQAYMELDNAVTRRLGLPEKRTRYHNPHITAADLMKDGVEIRKKTAK